MLFSKNKNDKISGIYAAGEVGDSGLIADLRKLLQTRDIDIRRGVAIALMKLNDVEHSQLGAFIRLLQGRL